MSNLTRWEPVTEMMTLREAMDRLFDDAFTRPLGRNGNLGMPSIDMYQTDNEVVVKAALPGWKPEDVEITVNNDVLTLRGEYKQESEEKDKDATYHIREQQRGSFERQVMLPTEVQADKAQADFENGILSITLPKAEYVKPKTINIKAK